MPTKPSRRFVRLGLASAIALFAICMAILFKGSREFRRISAAESNASIAVRR